MSIRGQIVAKKITDEENRTARKSHSERTAVVYRGHGRAMSVGRGRSAVYRAMAMT